MTQTSGEMGILTRAVHAGEPADAETGAVGVPIHQNSTFAFASASEIDALNAGELDHYVYSRYGNPTTTALQAKLADLEGAEAALVTASGMAAISTTMMHVAASGGHVVTAKTLYPVAREFFREGIGDFGIDVSMVDTSDHDEVRAAITPETRAIYVETVANPTLEVMDIPALARIAHDAGAMLIVDNTFLSPALYRPIEDGADLVIHSATKYLSGHGHVLGGVVAGNADIIAGLHARMEHFGGIMAPHTAWLLLHGVKTLPLRMRQHCQNAQAVADVLDAHQAVAQVNYPGLTNHSGNAMATRLTGGWFGGVLSLRFADHERARSAFLDALTIPFLAVSLGDAASLVWPFDEDGVIRFACGIEDTDDLVADVSRALAALDAAIAMGAGAVAE